MIMKTLTHDQTSEHSTFHNWVKNDNLATHDHSLFHKSQSQPKHDTN